MFREGNAGEPMERLPRGRLRGAVPAGPGRAAGGTPHVKRRTFGARVNGTAGEEFASAPASLHRNGAGMRMEEGAAVAR